MTTTSSRKVRSTTDGHGQLRVPPCAPRTRCMQRVDRTRRPDDPQGAVFGLEAVEVSGPVMATRKDPWAVASALSYTLADGPPDTALAMAYAGLESARTATCERHP